uniref:Clone 844 transcribed RNA sequence n=1 Tax=Plectreurys tristis TaxID=33319 RepID=A0A0C4W5R4_PLETR|nr:hypothetical protein [Plectreurys tristis]
MGNFQLSGQEVSSGDDSFEGGDPIFFSACVLHRQLARSVAPEAGPTV